VKYIPHMHRYTFAYIATTAVTNRGKRTSLYLINEQRACFDRPARSRARRYLLPGRSLLPSPIASSCPEFGLRKIRGIGDQERAGLVSARGPCETKKKENARREEEASRDQAFRLAWLVLLADVDKKVPGRRYDTPAQLRLVHSASCRQPCRVA